MYKLNELSGKYILDPDEKRVGKVISNRYNLGLGLFDINKLEDQVHRIKDDKYDDLHTLIWKPYWLKVM